MGRILRSGGWCWSSWSPSRSVDAFCSSRRSLPPTSSPRHRPRTPHSARRRRRSSCPSPTSRRRDHRLVTGLRRRSDIDRPEPDPHLRDPRAVRRHPDRHGPRRWRFHQLAGHRQPATTRCEVQRVDASVKLNSVPPTKPESRDSSPLALVPIPAVQIERHVPRTRLGLPRSCVAASDAFGSPLFRSSPFVLVAVVEVLSQLRFESTVVPSSIQCFLRCTSDRPGGGSHPTATRCRSRAITEWRPTTQSGPAAYRMRRVTAIRLVAAGAVRSGTDAAA